MKPFAFGVLIAATLCVAQVLGADEAPKDSTADEDTVKIYKRLIPADVLRGMYLPTYTNLCVSKWRTIMHSL